MLGVLVTALNRTPEPDEEVARAVTLVDEKGKEWPFSLSWRNGAEAQHISATLDGHEVMLVDLYMEADATKLRVDTALSKQVLGKVWTFEGGETAVMLRAGRITPWSDR